MYKAVFTECVNEIVIKRSRFITTLMPISGENEFESKLCRIRKKYSDATHNCYACVINDTATTLKFGDDGEPQGTAGMPMLEVLKKQNVFKTLAVVTRYFGGIKLGAGGLVGAYSDSVALALDAADVRTYKPSVIAETVIGYTTERQVVDLINRTGKIIDKAYSDNVQLKFALPQENYTEIIRNLNDITNGNCSIAVIGNEFMDYKKL